MKNLNVPLALAAGLIGGILSHYAWSPVLAQTPASHVVSAQSFALVDGNGKTVGVFTTEGAMTEKQVGDVRQRSGNVAVVLYDAAGKKIWQAGSSLQPIPAVQ